MKHGTRARGSANYPERVGIRVPVHKAAGPSTFFPNLETTMKAIIIALALVVTSAQAQTSKTRCVKNWDNSYTCTTTTSGGF